MRTPSDIGAQTELAVASALHRGGFRVYVPFFSPHNRVDLVYEDGERRLVRVQCKTSRLVKGVLSFRVCSNTASVYQDYRGEIDEFGVYAPELDEVFLVPVEHVATRGCHLRIEPTANGQAAGVRWANQ